jgi:FkbM family methyltransferase
LGKFDFVLCFGLLYHLENPLLAVRHLRALREKCLLLESMCVPDDKPSMLLREEPSETDQGLTDVACYPSEDSLIKMLYRADFGFVYRLAPLPKHDDFRETFEHRRKRTVLLASAIPIALLGFRLCTETYEKQDPWTKVSAFPGTIPQRISRFLALPAAKKYLSLAYHARRILPEIPIPWRLPFGAWWLARDGELDHKLVEENFERAELRFVERLLRRGMTVLDIGAPHGLYTLLCSKCVGRQGQVIAFEASPRECRRLAKHVRVNGCSNVRIEPHAVGSQSGSADLYVLNGSCNWGNSLRAPVVFESTFKIPVQVFPVDDVLLELGISRVDFIKLDVEGAELSALKGTARLLRGVDSVDALIGGYRFHSDAISSSNMERYNQRCDNIIESELKSIPRAAAVKAFCRVSSAVKNIPKVRGVWQRIGVKSLYHLAAQDWPPVIVDQENKWVIRGTSWRTKTLRR